MYNSEELIYSVNLNYGDCIEQLEKLTGRKPKEIFSEISKKYGIVPVYLGNEKLIDFEILEEQEKNEEEFE